MKLVLDSNILVSALLWDGKPARLLLALMQGQAILAFSPMLEQELAGVLLRAKFANRLHEAGLTAEAAVAQIRSFAEIIVPPSIVAPAELRDPGDLHILACASGADADAIVSGDKDLLVLGSFQGIPIIEVNEALRRLGFAAE